MQGNAGYLFIKGSVCALISLSNRKLVFMVSSGPFLHCHFDQSHNQRNPIHKYLFVPNVYKILREILHERKGNRIEVGLEKLWAYLQIGNHDHIFSADLGS